MIGKEKEKYKTTFKKELDRFTTKLEKYISTDNGDWSVKVSLTFTRTFTRSHRTPKSFQKSLKYTSFLKSFSLRTKSDIKSY